MAMAIVRRRVPGKGIVNALVDLRSLFRRSSSAWRCLLLYGTGGWLADLPFDVVFAFPGMVLATIFISLPFVVREVFRAARDRHRAGAGGVPLGASSFQTFRRVTFPAIRWAVGYEHRPDDGPRAGRVRRRERRVGCCRGEDGDHDAPRAERFDGFDYVGAYAALGRARCLAIATLLAMGFFRPKEGTR